MVSPNNKFKYLVRSLEKLIQLKFPRSAFRDAKRGNDILMTYVFTASSGVRH